MSPQRRFPNDAASVSAARRFVLGALDGIAPGDADAIAVMVSELAANAVRHTGSHFTVEVDRSPERIRIAVSDGGAGDPVIRTPHPEEPSGRGLQIVAALSAEWAITHERAEPIERRDSRAGESSASPSTRGGRGAPANRARARRPLAAIHA
jgi:anti-sigma regulatory factor (Ser/Thr protein kinase)